MAFPATTFPPKEMIFAPRPALSPRPPLPTMVEFRTLTVINPASDVVACTPRWHRAQGQLEGRNCAVTD